MWTNSAQLSEKMKPLIRGQVLLKNSEPSLRGEGINTHTHTSASCLMAILLPSHSSASYVASDFITPVSLWDPLPSCFSVTCYHLLPQSSDLLPAGRAVTATRLPTSSHISFIEHPKFTLVTPGRSCQGLQVPDYEPCYPLPSSLRAPGLEPRATPFLSKTAERPGCWGIVLVTRSQAGWGARFPTYSPTMRHPSLCQERPDWKNM